MKITVNKSARGQGGAAPSPFLERLQSMVSAWKADWLDAIHQPKLPNILAAITVAAVAMPLNLALAVASGLPPAAGLFSGAIGGFIAAAFGGSPMQVTGPAAALSVMVLALAKQFGVVGVAAACLIIGMLQVGLSLSGAGRLGKYVPESVLAGFTTGVGIKLLDTQLPELLGFPEVVNYQLIDLAMMMHRPQWLHQVSWLAVVSGLVVAFSIVGLAKYRRVPAAALAVGIVTFVSVYVNWDVQRVRDIGEVLSVFPAPSLPVIADEKLLDLVMATLPLALLASLESLLSAQAIDRMVPDRRPHEPNLELMGQGLANFAVGIFSGLPVTGVVVRSGVNVQSGATNRLSSLLHGLLLAGLVMTLAPIISSIPQAALAGLLCVVGFRLIEWRTLFELSKKEKVEAAAFAVTAIGTVTGHLLTGLVLGMVLHAIDRYLHRGSRESSLVNAEARARGVRATLGRAHAQARVTKHSDPLPSHHRWLRHIRHEGVRAPTAYVHPDGSVIGKVVLGDHVHVAADTSLRADEGSPFFIGPNSNIQDGVILHALKEKYVEVAGEEWAIYIGKDVSIAHNALIHGPTYIGDHSFVGFNAVVHDSVVGSGCYIGIGAIVVGVEIPDGRFVPHGTIVDTADAVDKLPLASEHHREFNEDVVEVNRGLAIAYAAADAETELRQEDEAQAHELEVQPWQDRWLIPPHTERF
jgi:SulP family sulfate permease